MSRPLATLLAVLVLSQPSAAQDSTRAIRDPGATAHVPQLTLTITGGTGDVIARDLPIGTAGHASIYTVAARWERPIFRAGRFGLAYRAEALPLVVAYAPRVADSYGSCINGVMVIPVVGLNGLSPCPSGEAVPAYGFGIAPIGLTAMVALPRGITAFIDGNAGILLFHRDFPINGAGHAAYALGIGYGLSIPVGPSRSIIASYRLETLSNGYTAIESPAMRSGVFQVGFGVGPNARGGVDADMPVGRTSAILWTAGVGVGAFDAVVRRYSVSTQLFTVNARWERTFLRTSGGVELRFAVDAIPLAIAQTGSLPDFSAPACRLTHGVVADPSNCPGVGPADDPAYGIGGSPFIIQYSLPGPGSTRLYAEGNVGGILFSRDFPLNGSRHSSFLLGFGGGLEIPLSAARALVVGYKLQHLSNGYTASRNPGMNLHYLSIGMAVRH